MAQKNKNQITLRIDDALLAQLEGEVGRFEFTTISEAARARLHSPDYVAPAQTVAAELRERKLVAEVTARELDNAKATGSVIAKDDVVDVWTKMCEPLRQAIQQVTNAVDGLTDEQRTQLEKWKEDTLTNLSGGGFE